VASEPGTDHPNARCQIGSVVAAVKSGAWREAHFALTGGRKPESWSSPDTL